MTLEEYRIEVENADSKNRNQFEIYVSELRYLDFKFRNKKFKFC
jgi:hypothetical protein